MNIVKWGILGPGNIAHSFSEGLKALNDVELTAVASRSIERSKKFAEKFGIKKAFGSYEEMIEDKEIDAIYIATPHNAHMKWAQKCIENGKAVLCEKPITINSHETYELIKSARENNVFLMEAMWSRFLPAASKLREILSSKVIGEVRMLKADFGYRSEVDPNSRLYNLELAGGALLDVGVYCVSLASMILGSEPKNINASAHIGVTGVDEQNSIILSYENGSMAVLTSAISTDTVNDAWIYGTKGYIHIPEFYHADRINVVIKGEKPRTYYTPYVSTGYNYEALEVNRCLRAGLKESSIMPLDETLRIMKLMDEARNHIGIKYIGE